MMCRSPKSRACCHFAAAIGLRSSLEGFVPTMPDWVLDQPTLQGKAMKRGLDYFREQGHPAADRAGPFFRTRLIACGRSSRGASDGLTVLNLTVTTG